MKFGLNVLVVEDNPHMQLLLTEILRSLGPGKIASATNLSEAREELGWKRYDIALVDVGLGGESGLSFVQGVRLDRRSLHRRMPMLVISGQGHRAIIEAARDAGADGFLAKPVSRGAVLDKVTRLIAEPQHYVEGPNFLGPDRRRRRKADYKGPERRGASDTYELS